ADDGEGVAPGGDDGAPFEHAAQPFYVGGGPVGEIAEGALTNLAAFATTPTTASSSASALRVYICGRSTPACAATGDAAPVARDVCPRPLSTSSTDFSTSIRTFEACG